MPPIASPNRTYEATRTAGTGAQAMHRRAAAAVTTHPRIAATGPIRRTAASPRKLPAPAASATAMITAVVTRAGRPNRSLTAGMVVDTAATAAPWAANTIAVALRAPAAPACGPAPLGLLDAGS